MMKKIVMMLAAVMVLAACESEETTTPATEVTGTGTTTTCSINFSPYEQEEMTRGAVSIATVVTQLDVWISDGTNVIEAHQTSTDAGFGSLSVTLDKTKTYEVIAVGHKAAGAATLTDGVIAVPDDKVTHAMVYHGTLTPATTTTLNAEMQRIVGQFKLDLTDQVPAEVVTMQFDLGSQPNRWDVENGQGVNPQQRTTSFSNFSRRTDGTAAFTLYAISTNDAATNINITVKALDNNGGTVQQRIFANVPIRNGYRTTYRGNFFIDTEATSNFLVGDWQDYDAVNF